MEKLIQTITERLNKDYNVWCNSMVYLLNLSVNKDDAMSICNRIDNPEFTERVNESYL